MRLEQTVAGPPPVVTYASIPFEVTDQSLVGEGAGGLLDKDSTGGSRHNDTGMLPFDAQRIPLRLNRDLPVPAGLACGPAPGKV
jgi:hypothetical protein